MTVNVYSSPQLAERICSHDTHGYPDKAGNAEHSIRTVSPKQTGHTYTIEQ